MEKDQIILLEDRGLISITGDDAHDYLQNIVTNDINKVSQFNSIFSGLFTPQGKYLYEFFIIRSKNGFFLDCYKNSTRELIEHLSKYKLRSKIEIKDLSSEYTIGVINYKKFKEIQLSENKNTDTIIYRESPIFIDPRKKELGVRILSSLENFYLTIKKLNLKTIDDSNYCNNAYLNGIPTKGLENLQDQLFGLEANFEELKAIDFKKGCYVGQENTARMKLKNKLRKRLLAIKAGSKLKIGDDIFFNNSKIGKILISDPYPFALIKIFDPDFCDFKDKEIFIDNKKIKIINNY